MKKRILSLLLSLIMVLSLLPTTAWAAWGDNWGFGGGSYPGTTTNTVDHIDINTTLQAKVVIDGKTYTQDVTFSWNDTQNGNLTITATQDEQPVTVPDYKYGGDGGDWSSPQVRLDANFPIGTKDNPVEYTLTLKKTLTINGVSVPVTLVVQVDYWSKLNICPGQDGYNKGIDVGVFETNSNTGSLSIQKTVTGVALTEAKTFDFTVSGNGETQTLRVTIPAGSTTAIVSTMLPYGTYTVTEDATSAGINGYTLTAPSAQSVTLSSQNKTSTVSFTNAYAEEITVGNLTIKKEVSGVETGDKEFSFTVTNSDGTTVGSCAIKAGESHTFNNLPLGTYTVTESGADITGYNLTTEYNGEIGTSYGVTIGGTATQSGQTSRGIIGDIIDSVSSCGCGCEDCPCTRLICRCNSSCCDDCMCGGSTEQPDQPQPDQPQPDQPSTPTTPSATVTVTNTYTKEKTSVTVEKAWSDSNNKYNTRPTSITVQLLADGQSVSGKTATLTAANNWEATFSNLDKYSYSASGATEIAYSVEETSFPAGYTASVDGYKITNTLNTGDLTITKAFSSNVPAALLTGKTFTFSIKNAKNVEVATATIIGAGTATVSGLPIDQYTVAETSADDIPGFTLSALGSATATVSTTGGSATVTNNYTQNTTSINVEKKWGGDDDYTDLRPESITVQLLADGTAVSGKTLTLNAGSSWKGTFADLPTHKDGQEITYTVQEVNVSGYKSEVSGNAANGFTITNTLNTGNLRVKKAFSDNVPEELVADKTFKFEIKDAQGEKVTEVEITGKASHLIEKLPVGTYTVTEIEADDITGFELNEPEAVEVTVAKDETVETTITNTYEHETIDIPVTKVWEGDEKNPELRPASITVKLMNGETVVDTKSLTAENEWKATFEDVRKYDDNNALITYTVVEEPVANYKTGVVTANNDGSYTITNELAPVTYEAKVNIEKIVKKTGGNVAPGKEEFVFVAYYKGAEKNELVGEARIITDGVDTYISEMGLTVPASAFNLKDGNGEITLYVSEVKGSSAGWKYDDTVYTLVMTVENYVVKNIGIKVEISVFSIPDGQGPDGDSATVKLSFTNEFSQTKTPNRPHKPSKPITSVKTGDAGVAMYAMSGLLSLGGAALFMKKRKDEE